MNYVLLIIIKCGNMVTFQSQNFKTEISCLQAIEKTVSIEKKLHVHTTAFCVKD